MPNPQKINAVAEIKKLFDDASSIFVTDYQGLSVAEITGRSCGGSMTPACLRVRRTK